jgi:hypothetical protein
VVVYANNPSTQEAEGALRIRGQAELHSKTLF